MIASEIILRARHVSDLPSSQFVDHNDELASMNESWKDIYAALLENDDDYFLTETTLTLGPTFAVAGTTNEYLLPLPEDCSRIRYVDYRGTMDWLPMLKFNLSMKDNQPASPYYRIKGAFLWVIGASVPATGLSVKIGYYPVQATITCPQADLAFGTSYTAPAWMGIGGACYAAYGQSMVYTLTTGTIITAESISSSTVAVPVALFTEAAAVTNLVYYKGTLYWIRGGSMWYKASTLIAAFAAPTQVGAIVGVVAFCIVADTIYYANATQIRSCTLTGGSDALVLTAVATSLAIFGTTVVYATAAGAVVVNSPTPTTIYASGITKITGNTDVLCVLDSTGDLRRVTLTIGTTAAVATDEVIDTKVTDIGFPVMDVGQSPETVIIGVRKAESQRLRGVDVTVDYDFAYPNNLIPEIMAYQSAIDYRAKQNQDTGELKEKLVQKWNTFSKTIHRDDYLPTRIRNAYPAQGLH
ncbi:MAG TPA: hypothetical protein VJ553_05375 [Candidatus Paceibacterota bacterium]|nr:hypothetical protein [Candidatus Paceibacterota bacterium]